MEQKPHLSVIQCYPSYSTIGKTVGMSKNIVSKHVRGLEAKKLITTEPTSICTKDGQKRNGSLLYTIRPIQEAVDFWNEAQLSRARVRADANERGPPSLFERVSGGNKERGTPPTGKAAFLGQIWGSFRKLPEPQNTPQKAGGIPVSGQGKHSVRLYTVRRSRANPAFPQPLKGGERQNTPWEKGQKAPPISEQDKGGMLPEAANRRKTPSGRAGRQVKDVC